MYMHAIRLFAALLLTTLCAGAAGQTRPDHERYFDSTVIPGIDRLQEDALSAVRTADPERLGNALLMLILARDSLSPALTRERRDFLGAIAVALKLATEDELARFRNFLDWSGRQSPEAQRWMPETRAALIRFERHIADADPAGAWLPRWVDSIPLLPPAGTGAAALPPAWTWRGRAVAKELADAADADADWRANVLAGYRKNALAAWQSEAAALWDGIPKNIPDAEIPARLRRIAEGGDPASRFVKLAAEHLLPMFDDNNAGDDAEPPEILWLRRRIQREARKTRGKPLPAATDAEAVAAATRQATDRTAALNAAAGGNVWPTLSPLAVDVYTRHLLARRKALELDALWRRTVYTPARFSPDDPAQSRDRLVAFLTGPADGLWTWRETGGDAAVVNATLHGVPFSFSQEFLAYCNATLAAARSTALTEIPLAFTINSVTAAGKHVLERPTAARFRLGAERGGKDGVNTLTYNNYPAAAADWTWTPDITEAEIRITFPSHTATLRFTTPAELKKFALLFGEGRCILAPEDFGSDSAPVLRRLGVEEIIINATLSNLEKLLPQLARPPLPPLPMSIIPKRGERSTIQK